jgi:YVTN family beta-propeller protein
MFARHPDTKAVEVEFRVLGDLEVRHHGTAIPLGPRQQRAVLALLVLHVGETVSVERIVDAIWGEAPPATAAKTVHVYVSRLRKALAPADAGAIVTRDHGYALRVDPEQVDALVFERLVREGREALADGDPSRAEAALSAALALWQGPPLGGLASGDLEALEIARLVELHLEALESRIDADLALGRHARVVGELEMLAACDPLREGLQRRRMLALYRSGRQSEALAVYHATRHRLIAELGIEPTASLRDLHDAILRQDPALEVAAPPVPSRPSAPADRHVPVEAPSRRSRRRAVPAVAVAAVALAAGVAVVTAIVARTTQHPVAARIAPNTVGVIDPGNGRLVTTVPVGVRPGEPVVARGSVWVPNLDDDTVTRIDVATRRVAGGALSPGGPVTGIAAGAGSVWVGDASDGVARRVDPAIGVVTVTTPSLRRRDGPLQSVDVQEPLAVGGGALWAAHSGVLTRLDQSGRRRLGAIRVGDEPVAIAIGAGGAWVTDDIDNDVLRIADDAVVDRIPMGDGPGAIAIGAGAIWVAERFDGTVARIDPVTHDVTDRITVGREPRGLAVLGDTVWVADSGDGTLSAIDGRTRRVRRKLTVVGGSPAGLAVVHGRLWVSVQAPAAAVASAPPAGRGGVVRVEMKADFDSLDPALAYTQLSAQVLTATCAKLYNFPDLSGPAGARIVPEVARGLPRVSRDGLRQTFTIRSGFRFSPPSGAPVTARTFRHAIERSVAHKLGSSAPAIPYLDDVVGARAFEARRARHIAGVTAAGDRLVVRTTRPAPDLPLRFSLSLFCAVPDDAPPSRKGISTLPSAGPYSVVSAIPGRQAVLARNPYYRGPRPAHADVIDIRLGTPPATAVERVTAGTADYYEASGGSGDLGLRMARRLEARYGAARPGARRRFFVNDVPGGSYIALNTSRPLFARARLRRAVNFAIDRAALAAQVGANIALHRPADQYIPPSLPGFRDRALYPLHGDVARARRLAGPGRRHATLVVCNQAPCPQWAAIIRANLAGIGIDVTVRQVSFRVLIATVGNRRARYDMIAFGREVDFPDPQNALDPLVRGGAPASEPSNASLFADPAYDRRLAAAARLSGPARYAAYARLDADLAGRAAPLVAFGVWVVRDYFSARVGCQVFQPTFGMDLAALCVRRP